jgi:hypothetical protein
MASWYVLWTFGIFYGLLVYFMAFWYTLWPFGKECCPKKNLATLPQMHLCPTIQKYKLGNFQNDLGGATAGSEAAQHRTFVHFRSEIEKLTKRLKNMERDTADWKEKFEASNDQVIS